MKNLANTAGPIDDNSLYTYTDSFVESLITFNKWSFREEQSYFHNENEN